MVAIRSAHSNKHQPIPLTEFGQKPFSGNITAYKVDWDTTGTQKFPISSAQDLNLSDKGFKALQILFPYLDKVFRGTGAAYLPQLHSSIANHLQGLQNLCDEIFNPETRSQLPSEMQNQFDKVAKLTRLSLMLHDLSEIPGEISTFCQRLSQDESPTEEDRERLENTIAETLIYYALKAAYNNQNSLEENLHAAILNSQKHTQNEKTSAKERFCIVKNFADKFTVDPNEDLGTNFNKDYEQLKAAYHINESKLKQEACIPALVKLMDKLESYLHTSIVGDYSLFDINLCGIFEKDFNKAQGVFKRFQNDILARPLIEKIFKLFEQSIGIFREWSKLNAPLKPFEIWLS